MRWGRLTAVLTAMVVVGAGAVYGGRFLLDQFVDPTCEFRVGESLERLSPEQAANAATISMVSVDRGLPPRAATVALATAIQESKLRNLTYGHADSLGLFQQRPSQGWGTAAQVRDPVFAANAFFDALTEVDGWEDGEVTVVAQAVQRSAYPDAYADHESEARVLASALVGQTHAAVGCRLDGVSGAGSPADLADKATRTFDAGAQVDGNQVLISQPSLDAAWATAGWAVSHAAFEQVVSVEVAGRRWHRDDPFVWAPVSGADPQSTQVRISVSDGS